MMFMPLWSTFSHTQFASLKRGLFLVNVHKVTNLSLA